MNIVTWKKEKHLQIIQKTYSIQVAYSLARNIVTNIFNQLVLVFLTEKQI